MLPQGGYYGPRYAPAKIRLRKGVYRYLIWRDGERKREFYLGKVRDCTPKISRPADLAAAGAGELPAARAGVKPACLNLRSTT